MKILSGFRVFQNALWQKNENPEMLKINRKVFNNKNHPLLTVTVARKLLKTTNFVSKYYFGFKNTQNYF